MNDNQRALLERLPGPAGGDLPALRRLEKRGLVAISSRVARRAPRTNPAPDRVVEPTPAQAEALAAIEAAPGEVRLLQGVTGSGKTEVYLRAAAAALERGEGVIALVPEIALTPQTVARFAARFGDTVALLHSALSEGERYDEWRRLRSGEARIAVGPRSAIFAPVERLGLIVVDEEHDASYKQESDPRYDARHVAAYRAYQSGARLLAGSATPRPETVHRMKRLRLPTRVAGGRDLPPVRVLDMRGAHHSLHPETRRALGATRKSIVLLNRRGWSNFLTCKTCGKAWECPNCDVALVLHRAENVLACHHCGHRERVPSRCDVCGSLSVARHGAGTERVEAELAAALDVPVFRLDADTAANKDAVPELLARFQAAPDRPAARHADGGQGPRFRGRHARRRPGRGLDAALPGLPRRGAHVRADRPARGPRRARAARRPRARPDQRPRSALDRRRRPPRRRRLPARGARAPPRPRLSALRRPDPRRHERRSSPPRPAPPRSTSPSSSRRSKAPSCSARPRSSASAAASATSSSSRPPRAPTPSRPPAPPSRPPPATAPSATSTSPSTSTPS